jgi:hypothetical protein
MSGEARKATGMKCRRYDISSWTGNGSCVYMSGSSKKTDALYNRLY